MKKIEISVEEYISLRYQSWVLTELENFGVDNWNGYEEIPWEELREDKEKLRNELTN